MSGEKKDNKRRKKEKEKKKMILCGMRCRIGRNVWDMQRSETFFLHSETRKKNGVEWHGMKYSSITWYDL